MLSGDQAKDASDEVVTIGFPAIAFPILETLTGPQKRC